MDSHLQKSRFLRSRGLKAGFGKAARVAASAGLVIGLFGPMPFSPFGETATPASADNNLNWEAIRPPLAVATGSTAPYTSLTKFGATADLGVAGATELRSHPIIVAPNGDVFAAGKAAAGTAPRVYKSTDGGKSWSEGAVVAGVAAAVGPPVVAAVAAVPNVTTTITGLAVSPKYPGDNIIFATFTDGSAAGLGVGGTSALVESLNGVLVSRNGGASWSLLATFGAAVGTGFDMTAAPGAGEAFVNPTGVFTPTVVAVSPNFDDSTGAGVLVIAGKAATGVDAAYRFDLNSGATVNKASAVTGPLKWKDGAGTTIADAVNARAIAFSPDFSNDGVIGLLYSCPAAGTPKRCLAGTAATYAVRTAGSNFVGSQGDLPIAADKLQVPAGTDVVATNGGLAFPADYRDSTSGGTYYASVTTGLGTGGIFKHTSASWSQVGTPAAIGGLAISGTGSSVNLLGAVDSSNNLLTATGVNQVHRSTSAADSFTTVQSMDGEKNLLNVEPGINRIAMAPDYPTSGIAYATLPGALGGVVKTTNKGSNWVDTGLTNEAFTTISSVSLSTPSPAGLMTMTDGTNRSLFWTDNRSTTSTWTRIHRVKGTTTTYSTPADFKTANTLYAYDTSKTSAMIIKSTDGGRTWDTTSSDPFSDAKITTMDNNGATRLIVGDDKGRVWNSSDGGGSWTQATGTLGQRITSFRRLPDFGNKNTIAASAIAGGSPEVFLSEDGAVTFKQIGSSLGAWGTTSSSTAGVIIRNDSGYFTNKMLYVRCNTCSDTDVWRMKVGTDTVYSRMGVPSGIRNLAHHTFIGPVLYMMGSDGVQYRTWYGDTVTDSTWNKLTLASPVPQLNNAATPPVMTNVTISGGITDVASSSAGTMFWYASGNPAAAAPATATQLWGINWTTEFLAAPKAVTPPDATNVPTNVGDKGTPTTFTWSSVNRAQCYDFQLALDKDFNQLLVDSINNTTAPVGCPAGVAGIAANPSLTISNSGSNSTTLTVTALVQGNTYWWRTRVRSIGLTSPGSLGQGPWSTPASFAVGSQGAPTSPEPQLPADGSTMPNLGPTNLSWNNPSGTVQYQVQVIPLNQDGPGIDLIIGDPAQVASASYTVLPPVMGSGNYIILPGSTYNWRVRTTNKSGSLSPIDPSWGPWSNIRTFKTPRPSAASLTLKAVTPSATPTLEWKDSITGNFYYEVQLSQDKTFNVDPATATAAVYWNLQHGGVSDPLNSWKTPEGLTLEKGKTYFWRVRQRVQATPNGPDEVGIGWSATASFMVP